MFWNQTPGFSHLCSFTYKTWDLGEWLNLSVPRLPHLHNGNKVLTSAEAYVRQSVWMLPPHCPSGCIPPGILRKISSTIILILKWNKWRPEGVSDWPEVTFQVGCRPRARIQPLGLSIFLPYRNGTHAIGTLEGLYLHGSLGGSTPPEILTFTWRGSVLESGEILNIVPCAVQ